jgi:hypothetical protein
MILELIMVLLFSSLTAFDILILHKSALVAAAIVSGFDMEQRDFPNSCQELLTF